MESKTHDPFTGSTFDLVNSTVGLSSSYTAGPPISNCTVVAIDANGTTVCEHPDITRMKATITLVTTCVNIVIAIGILLANSLVLAAFVKYKFVRTIHNGLLFNMSMADLCTAPAIILANVLTNFFIQHRAVEVPCVLTAWLFAFCFEGQIWMLLLVTINRWVSIRHPLTHHLIFSPRKTAVMAGSVWVGLFSITTGCSAHHQWAPGTKCYPFRVVKPLCYQILVYPLILLPLLLMPVLYAALTRYAHRQNRRMQQYRQTSEDHAGSRRAQELRTLRTLGVILGILYISWVPTFVLAFIMTTEPRTYTRAVFQKLYRDAATSCLYLGSLLNPVVYHRSSPTFRRAFQLLLGLRGEGRGSSSGQQDASLPMKRALGPSGPRADDQSKSGGPASDAPARSECSRATESTDDLESADL